MADLLTVTDVCIEASEVQARLIESRGKGPSRKKDDREVNTADRGDRKDHGDRGYRGKQSLDQKENRPFQRPDDAEKWCEIHRTSVWCWIRSPAGDQVSSTRIFHYRMDWFRFERHRWVIRSLGNVFWWILHPERSRCWRRAHPHEGDILKYAIQLDFSATNNIAEYEGLITGLQLAKELGIRWLLIHGDSLLVEK
jgi:hypothetical protein